jgi:hypothetical protein
MIQLNKFEGLYERFPSLWIRMTQLNKFRDLNGHFTGLETRMTQTNKLDFTPLKISYLIFNSRLFLASYFLAGDCLDPPRQ